MALRWWLGGSIEAAASLGSISPALELWVLAMVVDCCQIVARAVAGGKKYPVLPINRKHRKIHRDHLPVLVVGDAMR
ncbi:MAG: hypothetical protein BJG00_008730 [Limnothrix sp. CACIAM 69d]|nr:MAG: hypothetical protein BJG00_008730 [Limnothrix sp. CACIAM 69d]